MIGKIEIEKLMDALMLRYWGIFSIDNAYREAIKTKSYFAVSNSILDEGDKIIIAIAVPYALEGTVKPSHKNMAKVEAFAWDFDYHVQVETLLNHIKMGIESLSGQLLSHVTLCVDKSPFNDREVGFYAGLGRIGYNHLLIHEHLGSNFFIGYLVIHQSISFDPDSLIKPENLPDKSVHPHCKVCKKCLIACPSQVCGLGDVDMTACLSALTQSKEEIHDAMRVAMHDRLYGCSICQIVCPLNGNQTAHGLLTLKSDNWLDALSILEMTNREFKRLYGHMGFSWRPPWLYKRNALIVLGNIGDDSALKALIDLEGIKEDKKLSDYYVWAINRIEARKNEQFVTFEPKTD